MALNESYGWLQQLAADVAPAASVTIAAQDCALAKLPSAQATIDSVVTQASVVAGAADHVVVTNDSAAPWLRGSNLYVYAPGFDAVDVIQTNEARISDLESRVSALEALPFAAAEEKSTKKK